MRGACPWFCVAIVALSAGCQGFGGGELSCMPARGGEGAEGTGGPAGDARRGPTPAPTGVRIAAQPGRYREVGIALEAHGPGTVRLRRDVAVERAAGEGFERVAAEGLTLRPDCATEAPECIELAPGAELAPPPWTGVLGEAQCDCDDCRPAPPGRYRFVVTTCDGAHRIESAPFAIAN